MMLLKCNFSGLNFFKVQTLLNNAFNLNSDHLIRLDDDLNQVTTYIIVNSISITFGGCTRTPLLIFITDKEWKFAPQIQIFAPM